MSSRAAYAMPQTRHMPPIARGLLGLAFGVARLELRLRTRNALGKLDDHLLRDIGLDQMTAQRECDKGFWTR